MREGKGRMMDGRRHKERLRKGGRLEEGRKERGLRGEQKEGKGKKELIEGKRKEVKKGGETTIRRDNRKEETSSR